MIDPFNDGNGHKVQRVDPHRHFGGSIPARFVWNTIREYGLHHLAEKYEDVVAAMVYGEDEPRSFHRFLDKFNILNNIPWNEDLIDKSIKEVCNDLKEDEVDYTWMRFSINKYMDTMDWHRKDAIKFIRDRFEYHAPSRVGLVLCLKYESERAGQRQVAHLIEDAEVAKALVGIDLVGDEAYFDRDFYSPLYRMWKDAGKLLFAHVGESQPEINVLDALETMGVTEICHGLKAAYSPNILKAAKACDACFHMALTSNLLTGVLSPLYYQDEPRRHGHPIVALLLGGVKTTIGTDDPIQCNTSINREYRILFEYLDGVVSTKQAEGFLRAVAATASWRATVCYDKYT